MPRYQALVGQLNNAFSRDQISQMAKRRQEFAPGKPLDKALADLVSEPGTVEHRTFRTFVGKIPASIQSTVRSVIDYALSTDPPTLITFAWAPGYDHEVTIWQAPDTPETRGGVTMLFKSRYPDDRHPIAPPESS